MARVARAGMSERFDAADIRHYYDRHSARFVRYGQGGGSIHRAVWGEGYGPGRRRSTTWTI